MNVRTQPSVLWREGMFLCPQHMQAFARELHARIGQNDAVGRVGNCGLVSLAVDEEALERDVFRIESAEVVFPDGTLAIFHETAVVEQREFAKLFTGPDLDVHLGLPAPQENVPQVGDDADRIHRYQVETRTVHDENLRDAARELEFRQLRGRLFFGDEDRSGFDTVPIARLVRQGHPVATSVLSPTYVPPAMAVGASQVLVRRLAETAEKVRGHMRDLASRVPASESLSSVDRGVDLLGFVKLQSLNQSIASLEQLAGLPSLHPFHAYLWLVQTTGNLAVYSPSRVMPELPVYDHDDLDRCFNAAFDAIDSLVVAEVSVPYDTVGFKPDPDREGFFEVDLPAEWLNGSTVFYLGIECEAPADDIADMAASGVKLIAPSAIERVLQGVVPGIPFTHQRIPPLAFPKRPDLHFFRIETEGPSRDAWLKCAEDRSAVILSALGAFEEVAFHVFVELRD
jgi:type VI secretion system protein ImpJ